MKTKFNRFYVYCIVLITLFFGVNNHVNAQCSYDNTLEETWTAPGSLGDSVSTDCIYAGKFIRVTGMVSGEVYQISTCGNTNFDSQITIYPAGGGTPVDYNDDACGAQSEIIFIPPSNGDYDILIDEYYCGPPNTTCMYLLVKKIPCPAIEYADIYVSSDSVCPGDNVDFDVYVSGNSVSAYLWDFGDGNTSNQEEPSHSYTSAGTYPVSLTLTNGCGYDTVLYYIIHVINDLPFTADYIDMFVSSHSVCPGDNVYFEVYFSGCSVSSYVWDFDDGNTSNQQYTTHSYTFAGPYFAGKYYNVSLTLTNGCGNDTVLYDTIYVGNNVHPDPDDYMYDISSYEACPGDNVLFIVFPSGGSYLWDFGDGNTTTFTTEYEINGNIFDIAKHAYSSTGNYTVTFTLTNGCGNSFTDYFNVDIDDNLPVDGWFWWYPYNPDVNENIEFSALGGSSYQWDFGDGSAVITSTSSLTPVNHSYASPGNYTVNVTVTNSCGNSETYTENINIAPVGIQNDNLSDNDFLNIYPNPNNGSFTMEIENNDKEKLMLQIMNITGQIIYTKQLGNKSNITHKIDLSNHSKGIFLVKVQHEEKYEIKKVIIY